MDFWWQKKKKFSICLNNILSMTFDKCASFGLKYLNSNALSTKLLLKWYSFRFSTFLWFYFFSFNPFFISLLLRFIVSFSFSLSLSFSLSSFDDINVLSFWLFDFSVLSVKIVSNKSFYKFNNSFSLEVYFV